MNSASSLDRLALRKLAFRTIAAVLFGYLSGVAMTVVSRTVKATTRAAGAAVRITNGR